MVTRRLAAQKFHKNPWGLENFCAFFHPAPPSEIFLHNDLYEDFFFVLLSDGLGILLLSEFLGKKKKKPKCDSQMPNEVRCK